MPHIISFAANWEWTRLLRPDSRQQRALAKTGKRVCSPESEICRAMCRFFKALQFCSVTVKKLTRSSRSPFVFLVTFYWVPAVKRVHYISKACDNMDSCRQRKHSLENRCYRDWWADWMCEDCCTGDRCNYYVTVSLFSQSRGYSFIVTFSYFGQLRSSSTVPNMATIVAGITYLYSTSRRDQLAYHPPRNRLAVQFNEIRGPLFIVIWFFVWRTATATSI